MMRKLSQASLLFALLASRITAFVPLLNGGSSTTGPLSSSLLSSSTSTSILSTEDKAEKLELQKKRLLELLRVSEPSEDAVLANPDTKEQLSVEVRPTVLGSNIAGRGTKYKLKSSSSSETYAGSSDTFINLLTPVKEKSSDGDNAVTTNLASNLIPLIPPPLRSALAGLPVGDSYVPMRDLFTSPSVSFAYERGWRQGFGRAGFPGADKEAAMAMEYFEPAMSLSDTKVLVDMSCATGLFTRRFAASGKYKRVLGCDYSESMLTEARRRIESDRDLRNLKGTQLDLVRLDVGRIPMQDASVDALHAGAAMHCWPDLPAAASEIYRVLKPGGRYFATTFLSSYFAILQQSEGGATGPSTQAFQYFKSTEQLRSLMESGGFKREKILIEVIGDACVVIRCEK